MYVAIFNIAFYQFFNYCNNKYTHKFWIYIKNMCWVKVNKTAKSKITKIPTAEENSNWQVPSQMQESKVQTRQMNG